MGCYGLGITRVIAAAIEQHHDQHGIIWPETMAPFQVALIGLKNEKSKHVAHSLESLYQALLEKGVDVLLDDRKASPGVKLADMDLIGIPHRLIVSERGIAQNAFEYKRRGCDKVELIKTDHVVNFLMQCTTSSLT